MDARKTRTDIAAAPRAGAAAFRALFLLLTLALASACGDDSIPAEVNYRHAVQKTMGRFHVPGAVVAVRVPGQSEWREAFGFSDVATQRPIGTDEYFAIRSVTKSLTVTLILQLARDGLVGLDDPIAKYVAGIPNGDRITLTHLAAMESGVKNYTEVGAFLEELVADLARPWTDAKIVGYAIPESPVFEPTARYNYSNTNTILLGMVIERVTGKPIGEVYRERIWIPLGLAHTAYPNDATMPSPHPTPYEVHPATGELEPLPLLNLSSLAAAGGLVATLDDLLAWGEALGSGALIGPALQAFRLGHARAATDGPTYDRYGVGIAQLDGWWGHTGEGFGFQAAVFRDPRSGAVIAVLLNSSQSQSAATEIFQALAAAVELHAQ